MHWVLVGTAALAVAAAAAMGLASVVTGWVPRGRRKVPRPKLGGYGMLVSAVGMSGFMFLGPFNDAPFAHQPLAIAGFVLWLAGMVMQMVAQRPGRTS